MIRVTKTVVLLLAASAACSGDTKGTRAVASSSAAATDIGTARTLDACTLLLKADVDLVFAPRAFTLEPKDTPDTPGTGKIAAVSNCTFVSRGATMRETMTVNLLARRAPTDASGVTVAVAKSGAVQLKATPVDVPGLGDAAYWVNMGSASRPDIQLNVFTGRRVWLIFGASAAGLDADTAVQHLTQLAKAALTRS